MTVKIGTLNGIVVSVVADGGAGGCSACSCYVDRNCQISREAETALFGIDCIIGDHHYEAVEDCDLKGNAGG